MARKSELQKSMERVADMTRPGKKGLDYLNLDVDFENDEKLIRLKRLSGDPGVLMWVRLMCSIYRVGACYRWDRDALEGFTWKYEYGENDVENTVAAMIDCRLFDKNVYESTGYLTSKGIQERAQFATARRKTAMKLPDGVSLIETPETEGKYERKPAGWRENCMEYGEYAHVWLTTEENVALCQEFGTEVVKAKITSLDANIENGNRKYMAYKNHAATIRNWCRQDKGQAKTFKGKNQLIQEKNAALGKELFGEDYGN